MRMEEQRQERNQFTLLISRPVNSFTINMLDVKYNFKELFKQDTLSFRYRIHGEKS